MGKRYDSVEKAKLLRDLLLVHPGIATMKVGERALIMCAPSYAIGPHASGLAPANCALVFDIEILAASPDRSLVYQSVSIALLFAILAYMFYG